MKPVASRFIYALGVSPVIWVAWFYLYVWRQSLILGFWPLPSHPDPKDAGLYFHHLSIAAGLALTPAFAIVAVLLTVHRRKADPIFCWVRSLFLAGFSLACFVAMLYFDPGRYWEWYLD
ncbi:MAG: hypothetical protein K1X53_12815 [Candidatus Sumerlaeaceae bacterium]|nr:hypothetical protein [Candidatus Sumerlaeaceae bacterium]